ncbi:MAG: hypothetical protein K0B10_09730 [Vicingaceae bacterium]|nr:hypothetical protein [Vicingaceae bacterium]
MKQPIICSALVLSVLLNFQTSLLFAQETPVESVDKTESKKDKKKDKDNVDKIEKTDKHTEIVKYRRGSLHTMIIEDAKLPKIDVILSTFYDAEFPDKYNNHTVGDKSFNLAQYANNSSESAEKEKDLRWVLKIHFFHFDLKKIVEPIYQFS